MVLVWGFVWCVSLFGGVTFSEKFGCRAAAVADLRGGLDEIVGDARPDHTVALVLRVRLHEPFKASPRHSNTPTPGVGRMSTW